MKQSYVPSFENTSITDSKSRSFSRLPIPPQDSSIGSINSSRSRSPSKSFRMRKKNIGTPVNSKFDSIFRVETYKSNNFVYNDTIEDIFGNYSSKLYYHIFDKINLLLNHFRSMILNAKILSRTHEAYLNVALSLIGTAKKVSKIIRDDIPDSDIAFSIEKISKLICSYEIEKFRKVKESLYIQIAKYENHVSQIINSIKNYTKTFESDEKERMHVIKSTEEICKKLKKKKKNRTKELSDFHGACYDLKALRKDNLRRILLDYNIINTMFVNLYLIYTKSVLVTNHKYRYEVLRDHVLDMEDLVSGSNVMPDELEDLLNNIKTTTDPLESLDKLKSGINMGGAEMKRNKIRKQNILFFSNIKPAAMNPRKAVYQYLGTQEKELDLAKGDLIICYSDVYDGWQYGLNIESFKRGWFPASFTKVNNNERNHDFAKALLRKYNCPVLEDVDVLPKTC